MERCKKYGSLVKTVDKNVIWEQCRPVEWGGKERHEEAIK